MIIPEWTKKIEYGVTNESYILKTQEVLRVSNNAINKIIDRKNESNVLEIIKMQKNLSTEIISYGIDGKSFYLKTKFLPFAFNLSQIEITKEIIDRVYKLTSALHKINVKDKNIKVFNYKNFINNFKNKIINIQIKLDEYDQELDKIFQSYVPKENVLSHNDMVRGNFLFDDNNGKHDYIIDFEYASLNDPLYDIASFISESLIMVTDEELRKELTSYWKSLWKLDEEEEKMIDKWIFFQNVSGAYWANAMYDITKRKIFKDIIKDKYHELRKMY